MTHPVIVEKMFFHSRRAELVCSRQTKQQRRFLKLLNVEIDLSKSQMSVRYIYKMVCVVVWGFFSLSGLGLVTVYSPQKMSSAV